MCNARMWQRVPFSTFQTHALWPCDPGGERPSMPQNIKNMNNMKTITAGPDVTAGSSRELTMSAKLAASCGIPDLREVHPGQPNPPRRRPRGGAA